MTALTTRVSTVFVAVVLTFTVIMLRSVITPVALGALFAVLLHPLHVWLRPRLKKAGGASPAIVLTGSLILVVAPVVLICVAAFGHLRELVGEGFSEKWESLQKSIDGQMSRLQGLADKLGVDVKPSNFTENVPGLMKSAAQNIGEHLADTPALLLNTFLLLLAVYFFLRDGAALVNHLSNVSPFTKKHTTQLVHTTHDAIYGSVLASIVSGLVQAVLVLLSQWILGVPLAILWAVAAFLLSFLPMVGTTPITLGSTLYLFLTDHPGQGIAMAVMSGIIGVSDNFTRPFVQGTRSDMHPLIALLSIFGALELLGAAGVFLGPVIMAVALWCIEIYADDVHA